MCDWPIELTLFIIVMIGGVGSIGVDASYAVSSPGPSSLFSVWSGLGSADAGAMPCRSSGLCLFTSDDAIGVGSGRRSRALLGTLKLKKSLLP